MTFWEGNGSLEWILHLVAPTVSIEGFVSMAVETAPLGPHPQDEQLVVRFTAGQVWS